MRTDRPASSAPPGAHSVNTYTGGLLVLVPESVDRPDHQFSRQVAVRISPTSNLRGGRGGGGRAADQDCMSVLQGERGRWYGPHITAGRACESGDHPFAVQSQAQSGILVPKLTWFRMRVHHARRSVSSTSAPTVPSLGRLLVPVPSPPSAPPSSAARLVMSYRS